MGMQLQRRKGSHASFQIETRVARPCVVREVSYHDPREDAAPPSAPVGRSSGTERLRAFRPRRVAAIAPGEQLGEVM